jgi:YfiH family protein
MCDIFYTFTTSEDGNLAYHVKDKKENVDKNRKNLANKHDFKLENLYYMNQVHGDNIQIIDKNSPNLIDNCDGIITNLKGITLMVMVADCIPVLIFDKTKGVIAAVHAGRNSTFLKIVPKTVKKMIDCFDCKVEDIEVILGPSIQKCCYEVSQELVDIVINSFGKEFVNNRLIDLQGINQKLLKDIGVNNITISDICTLCSKKPFYSYREDKTCGRFAGIISIM